MATPRPRNAAQTQADILSAARRRFATEGYEPTTLRAIAADVGVDAALVSRYFGSKQDLFATATEFRIDLPDLAGADPDDIPGMLLPRYFAVWEDDHTFLALLRAAGTSRIAADTINQTLADACGSDVARRHPGQPPAADCADGCVRHRACDDPIHPRQSTDRQPRSRRTQQLGRTRVPAATRWPCAVVISLSQIT